jgi:hypothetical protein
VDPKNPEGRSLRTIAALLPGMSLAFHSRIIPDVSLELPLLHPPFLRWGANVAHGLHEKVNINGNVINLEMNREKRK